MEIKHTVEILTKDIQDIEKLVRNLNNYTTPPQIELDLALSKLRNVYELLSMISVDVKSDNVKPIQKEVPNTNTPTTLSEEPETVIEALELTPEEPKAQIKEPVLKIVESKPEPIVTVPEPKPIPRIPEPVPEPTPTPAPEPIIAQEPTITAPEPSILGETFKQNESINEKNAEKETNGMSAILAGKAIESIKRNIGINDRFLIIREVMNGDNEGYNNLILKLDECPNFNQAFQLLETRFPENLEHDGVQVLVNLARRKFISRGNV